MVVIQSLGSLAELPADWWPAASYGSLRLASDYTADYETIYRTQPNVRTVIDFIARNIAQLGLHVFKRVSDTDRERLTDHPLATLLGRPNPYTTRSRMIRSTLRDYLVHWNAYWLKIRSGDAYALLRIPPPYMTVEGGLVPRRYWLTYGGKRQEFATADVVHFRGDGHPVFGISPLETLRRVLAEEYEAGAYRSGFWANAARMSGIVERPREAPEWSEAARSRFKAEFEALYSGAANSGKTAILEEGMTWKPASFSSRESEYLAGRKLTREEVARSYHVPLPMVGILDHATFSNIKEQHKNLYQDCLGPWLVEMEEELELQLVPDFADVDGVYLEFNIAEKLKGSFEEQAAALSSAVGRPWLTADEARARQNLPSLGGDAAQLVTPLNVLVGGQASPRDSAPPKALRTGQKADDDVDTLHLRLRERHIAKWEQVVSKFFERQRDAVIGRFPKEKAAVTITELFDEARWARELGDDMLALNVATATVWAERTIDALGPIPAATDDEEDQAVEFDPAEMVAYLTENARIAAEGINATTRQAIVEALKTDTPLDGLRRLFEIGMETRSRQIATTKVTTAANFGSHRGAEVGGARTKTWRVNSGNPRSQHRSLSGSTVDIARNFANGMKWPGDHRGGADEVANCRCSLVFNREARS